MTRLIQLTTFAAVLTAFAALAPVTEAGSCYRPPCPSRRPAPPRRPVPPPALPGPAFGTPGLGAPGLGAPGLGAPAAGGPQGGAGQAQQPGRAQAVNVPAGATITLPGDRGTQAGQVNLVLNGVRLPLDVLGWSETGVTVTLPDMQLTSPVQAQLEIVVPGSNAETLSIQLQPRPSILVVQ